MKKTANIFLITITVLFVLFCFSTCARISSDILGSSDSSSSNASGNSGGSSGGGGSEERITLDTPQNVSASVSGEKIYVSWNSVRGAQEYEVKYQCWIDIENTITTRSTSCSINIASLGYTYRIYVRAYDGNSGYSNWSSREEVSTKNDSIRK